MILLEKAPTGSFEHSLGRDAPIQKAMMELPEVMGGVSRSGVDELRMDPMGLNQTNSFLITRPCSEWTASLADFHKRLREKLEKFDGIDFAFYQPIDMRVSEMLTGVHAAMALPGYFITFGGQSGNQQRASGRLLLVAPTASVLIFLMLFTTFRSMRQADLIILNIPFAMIGAWRACFSPVFICRCRHRWVSSHCQMHGFTFGHVEGHSHYSGQDPTLSPRGKVAGYTLQVRADIMLEDADLAAVLVLCVARIAPSPVTLCIGSPRSSNMADGKR